MPLGIRRVGASRSPSPGPSAGFGPGALVVRPPSPSSRGSGSDTDGSAAPHEPLFPTLSQLRKTHFEPPISPLGASLRKRIPPAHSRVFATQELENECLIERRVIHVTSLLPEVAKRRIADGNVPGSASGLSISSIDNSVRASLKSAGGANGSGLTSKLTTLAQLADWARAPQSEMGAYAEIFSVTLPHAVIREFIRWQRTRGAVFGAVNAARDALKNLKFAAAHLGLDAPDLSSDALDGEAVPVVLEGGTRGGGRRTKAHAVPLRIQAGREAFALAYHQGRLPDRTKAAVGSLAVVFSWVVSRILSFLFGLRKKELRSASLERDPDPRLICLSFHPKGDADQPRIMAWRYAFGVLGEFVWWPRYHASHVSLPCPLRRFNTGNLFTATDFAEGLPPQGTAAHVAVSTLEVYGVSADILRQLNVQAHSDHGTLDNVILCFGQQLGLDPQFDCLVAGHWRSKKSAGSSSLSAAAVAAAESASRNLAASMSMPSTYADPGTHRTVGPSMIWRALLPVYFFFRDSGVAWYEVSVHEEWTPVRVHGLQHSSDAERQSLPFPPFGVVLDAARGYPSPTAVGEQALLLTGPPSSRESDSGSDDSFVHVSEDPQSDV